MSKSSFDKLKINLWVSGTVDKDKNGGWCAHLHSCINGRHFTKTIGGYAKNTTVTRMTLQAVLQGLKLIRRPSFVHIYTTAMQVSTGLNKYMYEWEKQGWLTSKGDPPKHVDLWKQIYILLQEKALSYRVHLQNQTNDPERDRLLVVQEASQYITYSKKDLYEVNLV